MCYTVLYCTVLHLLGLGAQEEVEVQQPPDGAVHEARGGGEGQLLRRGVEEQQPGRGPGPGEQLQRAGGGGAASPVEQRQPRVHAVHVGLAVRRLVPGVQAPAAPTLVMPETVLKNICGMRKILYLSKNTCSFSPQPYTAAVSEILNGS